MTGEFCLGNPLHIQEQTKDGVSIEKFFENLLIPYLYYLSYIQEFNEEPWPGLKHGAIGLLEEYGSIGFRHKLNGQNIESVWRNLPLEIHSEINRRISSGAAMKTNDKCFCGSGKKIKHCCGEKARKGLNFLLKEIKEIKASQN